MKKSCGCVISIPETYAFAARPICKNGNHKKKRRLGKDIPLDQQMFEKSLSTATDDTVVLIGEYKDMETETKFKCRHCQKEFTIEPTLVLDRMCCPNFAQLLKGEHDLISNYVDIATMGSYKVTSIDVNKRYILQGPNGAATFGKVKTPS